MSSAATIPGAALLGAALLGGCVPVNPSASPRVDMAAEQRASDNPQALDRIGAAALQGNDATTATEFYRRALSLDPSDASAALGLADGQTRQGHLTDAIVTLDAAARHAEGDDRVRIDLVLGRLLVLDHRPDEAEAAFRQGLEIAPGSTKLLTGLGVALDLQRNFEGAEGTYRRALLAAPDDVAARNDLALSLAIRGDDRQALETLESLRARNADAAEIRTVDGNIAIVDAMRGQLDDAHRASTQAAGSDRAAARNDPFYAVLAAQAGG